VGAVVAGEGGLVRSRDHGDGHGTRDDGMGDIARSSSRRRSSVASTSVTHRSKVTPHGSGHRHQVAGRLGLAGAADGLAVGLVILDEGGEVEEHGRGTRNR